MICKKCGSNQPDGAKFCSNCGSVIAIENEINPEESADSRSIEEIIEKEQTERVQTDSDAESKEDNCTFEDAKLPEKVTTSDKEEGKVKSFWNGLDLFCKIETVTTIFVAFLLFIALCRGKVFPSILSIIQLGGLIVAFLIHKGRLKCNLNWLKYAILAVVIIFTGLYFSSYSWIKETRELEFDGNKSDTPYSEQECVGKDIAVVKDDFLNAGFYNIEQEEINDLEITAKDKYGKVEAVSINGVTDFEGNLEFKSSSKVVIKYHTFKEIAVPLSSEEIKTMDAESVLNAFEEAGFFEFSTDEKYDLDPDETKAEFENKISINGNENFEQGEKFLPDADIVFVTHRPYEKYTLKIVIDFVPNLIFSTYDVTFSIDEYSEKLTHGNDAKFEYRLKQGDYTLTFTSAESSSVKGSVKISLNGDTEACYKISCTSDKVKIETQYIENKSAVGENQAMIPSSAATCKYKDYKDIEKAFKNAGFTNIKTKILYDIYWGITPEGEVDSVTVGGKSSFNRGDIVAKDADIVITYHMKEEDDPRKATEKKNEGTQYIENNGSVGENQARIPFSALNCKYKDYKDIEKAFENAGFINIKTKILYDIFWGITPEGEVDSVTVGGKSSFNRGDIVDKDAEIVITYHMKEEDNPIKNQEKAEKKNEEATKTNDDKVSYSTNTKSTVKNGNAGKYSYKKSGSKNAAGGWYDIYYIIDFDEGYVYNFCEGYGSEKDVHNSCDKIKIVSGNLNDVLIITYHDGSSTWSNGLHFKWKNQPDHLIMQDDDGFEYDFYTTNLNEALDLRNKKSIHNY